MATVGVKGLNEKVTMKMTTDCVVCSKQSDSKIDRADVGGKQLVVHDGRQLWCRWSR